MPDLIVFCPNTANLVKELRAKHASRLDEQLPASVLHSIEGRSESEQSDAKDKAWATARKDKTVKSTFLVDKTPTKRNGLETLSLVRANEAALKVLKALETAGKIIVLGTWEEVQADPKAKAIYDRVYPCTLITTTDEEGNEHTHTPSEQIGAFA